MAVLPDSARARLVKEFSQKRSANRAPFNLTRAQLRAVYAAADDWAEANSVAFNSAIPQPQRGLMSAQDKIEVLVDVIRERWGG